MRSTGRTLGSWMEMLGRRGVSTVLIGLIIVVLLVAAFGTYTYLSSFAPGSSLTSLSTPTALATGGMTCSNVASYDESIPPAYQSMYSALSQILDNFDQTLSSTSPVASHGVIYATELLPADSNIGQRLLSPQAMQGVINYLDAIQKLGVQGVTIDVSFPILTPTFPNYDQYLYFYENVVAQVRQRGMKIDIESETPLLVGYPGLSLGSLSYANLTYGEYVSEDKEMLQTVINDLHPD